jgi:hypothetical protein
MKTPLRSFLITGANPGEGKTTAATHLASLMPSRGGKLFW